MTSALSRTRRDHSLWDQRVNDLWGGLRPVLSAEESVKAARKLYRHAMGKAWPGKWAVVSGNRHSYPRRGIFNVNPDRRWGERGLRAIIHSISHYCHRRLHPGDKPHSIRQLRLEAKLTRFAVARWGAGAPPKIEVEPAAKIEAVVKPKPDVVVQRYQRMVARRDKWARELDRAKRLLAKAEVEARTYERRHRDRLKQAS
jgi:hypothetical protein